VSQANRRLGQWGERQARLHLEAKGYTIVATNFRCRAGEIDIVTRQSNELVFIEVKTRRGDAFGKGEESISEARAERLAAVAEEFLQSRPAEGYHSGTAWRIDLVCLNLDRSGKLLSVNHIPHAVEL
jgi:putative endonuclease